MATASGIPSYPGVPAGWEPIYRDPAGNMIPQPGDPAGGWFRNPSGNIVDLQGNLTPYQTKLNAWNQAHGNAPGTTAGGPIMAGSPGILPGDQYNDFMNQFYGTTNQQYMMPLVMGGGGGGGRRAPAAPAAPASASPPAAPTFGAPPVAPTRAAATAPQTYSYGLPAAPSGSVAAPPQTPAANPLSAAIRRPSSSYVATPAASSSFQAGFTPDAVRRRPFPAAPGSS